MSDILRPRDYRYNPSVQNTRIDTKGTDYELDPGAVYGDHIVNTSAVCNTSAAHTFGNVLGLIEKYLLDLFPPDVFKTVTASTSIANRQIRHLPTRLHKQEPPILVLVPRIVFGQGDDRFLGHTAINDRITNTQSVWGDGSLIPLAKDMNKQLYVHGHYNRSLMFVDVVMSFNTYSEQINWMSYLYNVASVNHNKFIQAPLELYIPSRFCNLIANVAGIPTENSDKSVHDFLSYMNTIWYYPITYKLKGSSNSDEYFMYYIADLDTVIQDPQLGQGTKNGQVRSNFEITFTIRCEFNTIGYFTLNAPNIRKNIMINEPAEDQAVVPMLTDTISIDDFHLPIGWQLLSWPVFKLKMGESSISLQPILNQSLNAVINYHLQFGIPMNKFIDIQFRENGQILSNEMFYIDWHTRMLHLLNPNYRRTYRLIITVNVEYVNNLVKEIYNLE